MPAVEIPLTRLPKIIFGPRRDPLGWLETLAREGDLVHIHYPTAPVYYAFHPDIIRECLSSKHSHFYKGRGIQRARLVLGLSTLTLEGEQHAERRRMLQPLFRRERLTEYAGVIVGRTCEMSARWSSVQTIDLAREMTHLALAIAAEVFLGLRLKDDEVATASKALTETVNAFGILMLPWGDNAVRLPLPWVKRFYAARETLRALARRAYMEQRTEWGSTLRNHSGCPAPSAGGKAEGEQDALESVTDELVTLLIAGHETTALMLTWAIYLLSQNPAVMLRARIEIEAHCRLENLSGESTARLPYLHSVIAETLRLYPPVWGLGRRAVDDVMLGNERIPKGAFVTMSPWIVHRDPRFYASPLSYCPERWENWNPPSYAYIPFGGGPRRCIGEGFAWMEGTLILASLLPDWDFELVSPPPDVKPGFTLRPRTPIAMRVTRR